jgi:hypothetical protein
MLLSIVYLSQAMSEDQEEERFKVDIDGDNDDFEERSDSDIAQPVEVIREEVITVVENPNAETSPMEDNNSGDKEDIYEQLRTQSIQLSRLADVVESLQSQVKQLQETKRLRRHRKSTSVRTKSRSNTSMKRGQRATKKKTTTRRRTGGSRKK